MSNFSDEYLLKIARVGAMGISIKESRAMAREILELREAIKTHNDVSPSEYRIELDSDFEILDADLVGVDTSD